ncbi:MAG: hypothetical protein Q9164_007269 [Protoblastenia rupestris]
MPIGSFTPADGVGMLQNILQNEGGGGISTNAAERIVSTVGALHLAIFQLGSYLKTTHSTPKEFIRRYQKPSGAARVDSWDEATPLTYQHTLATVWKLAFERLSPDSMLLLNILSFLDSDIIPDVLFLSAPEGSHFEDFDVSQDAMRYIRRYSLVLHVSGDGVAPGHVVHRKELVSIFLDGSVYVWERGFPDQARNLIAAAEKYSANLNGNVVLREIKNFGACVLSDMGCFDEAEQLFQDYVHSEKKNMEQLRAVGAKATIDNEIRLANAYNNLAGNQCCQGRYGDAGLHNMRSLELKQRWSETPSINNLISLSYKYFEKALGLDQFQNSVLRRALTAQNFGCMRLAQDQVELARELLTKAYQLRSERFGDHYETAGTLHMLSLCHFQLRQLENAK